MAKRWFQSVDLEIDDRGRPVFETALQAIQVASAAIQESAEALAGLIDAAELRVKLSAPIEADIVLADMERVTGIEPDSRNLFNLWDVLSQTLMTPDGARLADMLWDGNAYQSMLQTVSQRLNDLSQYLVVNGYGGPYGEWNVATAVYQLMGDPYYGQRTLADIVYAIENMNSGGLRDPYGNDWLSIINDDLRTTVGQNWDWLNIAQIAARGLLTSNGNSVLVGGPNGYGLADLLIGPWQLAGNYTSYMAPGEMLAAGLFGGPNGSSLARMLIGPWQPSITYQSDMEPGAMLASGLFGGPNSTSVARKLTAYSQYVTDMDLGDFLAEALCASGSGVRIADLLFNGYANASVADLLFDGSNSVAQLLSRGPSSGYPISALLEDIAIALNPLGGAYRDGNPYGENSSLRVVAGNGAGGEQVALDWSVRALMGDPTMWENQRSLYDLWSLLSAVTGPTPGTFLNVGSPYLADNWTLNSLLRDGEYGPTLAGMFAYDGGHVLPAKSGDQWQALMLDAFGNVQTRTAIGGGGDYSLNPDDGLARLLVTDTIVADRLYHADLNMPISYLVGNAAGGIADIALGGLCSHWSGAWLPDMLEAPDGETAISVLKALAGDSAFRRDGAYADWTTLSAPGVTADESFDYALSNHTLQVKVNNINTDVTVRLEGSIDETGWFPLAADLTIAANGTYAIFASGRPVYYVRGNFVSETGGADATVKLVYQGLR